MDKILLLSLGVISWLNVAKVYAVEKFEILPDLPDPLAYAVQPAEAASVSGNTNANLLNTQTIGSEPNIVSVIISLVIVILLIYLTGIIYAKLNKVGLKTLKKQQGEFARSQVSVVSTTQLGNNKTLHVVELDGKRMLIGASSGAIQLIKDLGSYREDGFDDEEYSHIEIPNIKIPKIEIPKIEIPSIGFSKLVTRTKTHKPINEVEEDSTSENKTKESENIVIEEDISSDGIIDSLFAQNNNEQNSEETVERSEHIVDPDDFALYKKYL